MAYLTASRAIPFLGFVSTLALAAGSYAGGPELEDVDRCGGQAFHNQHQICLDREARRLSADQRARFAQVLVIKRQTMALLDKQGADVPAEQEQLDRVLNCIDEAFHGQHAICFDRAVVKLSAEGRDKLGRQDFRQNLAQLDQSERRTDEAFAKAERRESEEAREKAAVAATKSPAELAAVIRNLCAGRHGDPEIGTTENEAVGTSWCYPIKTNETISAGHVRRQFVYHAKHLGEQWANGREGYLYFENGRLVAIQR
jgi:hypothetical protein